MAFIQKDKNEKVWIGDKNSPDMCIRAGIVKKVPEKWIYHCYYKDQYVAQRESLDDAKKFFAEEFAN